MAGAAPGAWAAPAPDPAPAPAPGAAPGAGAQEQAPPAPLLVIEVKGRIDAVVADFVRASIADAERTGAQALVLQVDSPGDLLSDAELDSLVDDVAAAPVPVLSWVGHIGAEALGGAARLVGASGYAGAATRTRLGRLASCPSCLPGDPAVTAATLGPEEAVRAGLVDIVSPNLGDFVVDLDGVEVGGRVLRTARVVEGDEGPRREPLVEVRFAKLELLARVLHGIASPSVAYLLLVVGLLLVLFELFSVGIGIAGVIGALSLVLASSGLAALGARPLGLALLGLGAFGFGVDVQSGAPRAWTVIGGVAVVGGSLALFPPGLAVPTLTLVAVLAGVGLFVLRAMPAMVRARFATARIDRRDLLGERGTLTETGGVAAVALDRGGRWKARLRAEGLAPGAPVTVVAIDGATLEVGPAEAAAPSP